VSGSERLASKRIQGSIYLKDCLRPLPTVYACSKGPMVAIRPLYGLCAVLRVVVAKRLRSWLRFAR
jgi:hypothetical protein